jgi:hypothetical protein
MLYLVLFQLITLTHAGILRDRGQILRALIAANGGKMLATDARKKIYLDRATFSVLLSKMKNDIEVKPYHLNKSWKVLVIR